MPCTVLPCDMSSYICNKHAYSAEHPFNIPQGASGFKLPAQKHEWNKFWNDTSG